MVATECLSPHAQAGESRDDQTDQFHDPYCCHACPQVPLSALCDNTQLVKLLSMIRIDKEPR